LIWQEQPMTPESSSWRLRTFLACLAAAGLLAACGNRDENAKYSASEAGLKDSCTRYLFVEKGLSENDKALFTAAGAGDVAGVDRALDAGANANAADGLKRTPLFAATFCNHPGVANLLMDKGADASAADLHGMSPLHVAVISGSTQVAQALLAKGVDVNLRSNAGRGPLHLAAATNQLAMAKLLLEHGANAAEKDKGGVTAAALATQNGHSDLATAINQWQQKHPAAAKK
jgi:hypothetical protein